MVYKLIQKTKTGDQISSVYLVDKFNPLLKKYASKLGYEDAYNDLILDFIELIKNFNISKLRDKSDGNIIAYLHVSIQHNYIKRLRNLIQLRCIIPFSELSEGQANCVQKITQTKDSHIGLQISDLKNILSQHELLIVYMVYYLGYSSQEIANIKKVSRQSVNQTKIRAINKIKTKVQIY